MSQIRKHEVALLFWMLLVFVLVIAFLAVSKIINMLERDDEG